MYFILIQLKSLKNDSQNFVKYCNKILLMITWLRPSLSGTGNIADQRNVTIPA